MVANRSLSLGSGIPDSPPVQQVSNGLSSNNVLRHGGRDRPVYRPSLSTGGSSWSTSTSASGEVLYGNDNSRGKIERIFQQGPMHYRRVSVNAMHAGSSGGVNRIHLPSGNEKHRTLHQMAREGDVVGVRRYLDDHVSGMIGESNFGRARLINELNVKQLTALHYAARYNHYEIVKLLVEKGADVKIKSEDGLTPLHFAARYKHRAHLKQDEQHADFREENDEVF